MARQIYNQIGDKLIRNSNILLLQLQIHFNCTESILSLIGDCRLSHLQLKLIVSFQILTLTQNKRLKYPVSVLITVLAIKKFENHSSRLCILRILF